MAAHIQPFQPTAYYDKHLDCIRVLILDVSTTEAHLNEYFDFARAYVQKCFTYASV